MTVLIVVNDAPYAGERPYNALRIATALTNDGNVSLRLFFLGDGAWCATARPKPEAASFDIEWMLRRLLAGREAAVCRTCMESRGIRAEDLIEGARQSTLEELTRWIAGADRVLTF